jgi:GMP synthase (glutamine-hydrolysing)
MPSTSEPLRVHVVADDTDREGGYVTERLRERGAELTWLDRDELPRPWSASGVDLVLSLGSERSAHDPRWADVVEAEVDLVRVALGSGVPVMAICYGAQLVARALGGTSYRGDGVEVGWRRVDTLDDVLCPEGPWGQFHQDVVTPPPTSRVVGTSWFGPQCFLDDAFGARVIAWQFHPEVTTDTFSRWVDESAALVRISGSSPEELKRQALANAVRSRLSAHRLVDDAVEWLEVRTVARG